jgi:hypothetical protein
VHTTFGIDVAANVRNFADTVANRMNNGVGIEDVVADGEKRWMLMWMPRNDEDSVRSVPVECSHR